MKKSMYLIVAFALAIMAGVVKVMSQSDAPVGSRSEAEAEIKLQNVRKLTSDGGFLNPVWSPTSSDMVAFISSDDPGTFVASVESGVSTKLSNETAGFKFFFTSDGKDIVYRDWIGDRLAVRRIDTTTGEAYTLSQGSDLGLPQEVGPGVVQFRDRRLNKKFEVSKGISTAASSHSRPFAYQLNDQIFVVAGGVTRQITSEGGKYFLPFVSPDGSKVLYQEISQGIFVSDLESGKTIHIGLGDDPSWSPDGQFITYEVTQDDEASVIASDLYVSDLTGRTVKLTDTPTELEMRPSWSADGRRIVFDSNGAIYVAEIVRR